MCRSATARLAFAAVWTRVLISVSMLVALQTSSIVLAAPARGLTPGASLTTPSTEPSSARDPAPRKPITVAAALAFCQGKTIKRRVTVIGYFVERPNIRGALDGALADRKDQLPAAADLHTNPWPQPRMLAVFVRLDVMLHSNGTVPERKRVLVTGVLDCSLPILGATKYPERATGSAQSAATSSFVHTSVWKATRFCNENPNATLRVQLSGYYQIDPDDQPPAGMALGHIYTLPPAEAARRGKGLKADIGPLALARQGSLEDGEHMRVRGQLLCSNQVLAIGRFWPLPAGNEYPAHSAERSVAHGVAGWLAMEPSE